MSPKIIYVQVCVSKSHIISQAYIYDVHTWFAAHRIQKPSFVCMRECNSRRHAFDYYSSCGTETLKLKKTRGSFLWWSEVVALYMWVDWVLVGTFSSPLNLSARRERERETAASKKVRTHTSIHPLHSLCVIHFSCATHISILMTPLLMEWRAREVLDFELE